MGRTPGHLDRARAAGLRQTLTRGVARWRLLAAAAIVAALLGFGALLFRPYLQNWRFQNYLENVAFSQSANQQAELMTRADIADHAAQLGLPVSTDQIRVNKSDAGLYLEVRYFVRVDLPLYTVDLHFRPSAGVR